MYRVLFAAMFASAVIAAPNLAVAHSAQRFVELSVIDDSGRTLKTYPAASEAHDLLRTYLQAEPGARYRLRLHNPNGERIGVVVAVDGRNIISGQRSELAAGEAMYVIGAHRTQIFSGWRTDSDHVQAFYFTDKEDSYAGAWGDYSAMGTIAVAVFREQRAVHDYAQRDEAPVHNAPSAESSGAPSGHRERKSRTLDEQQAGTGFGERRWSQSRRVRFAAVERAVFRQVVKYEWRSSLCRRGITACGEGNRLWPELGYAPYPPGYTRPRW
ncbi:MAG: hypothetical protein OET44_00715 [Gammaproteobacteria bacterium]|nr:hypothetical protein [Gammaproteobacteria bacterium]